MAGSGLCVRRRRTPQPPECRRALGRPQVGARAARGDDEHAAAAPWDRGPRSPDDRRGTRRSSRHPGDFARADDRRPRSDARGRRARAGRPRGRLPAAPGRVSGARQPVRRPSQALADLLDRRAPIQSRHEDRFLRLCQRFGLPAPLTQQRVGGRTVDFIWPDRDIDDAGRHGTTAFENDRSASNGLQLSGYVVLRFTDRRARARPGPRRPAVRRALVAQLTVPPVR